MPSKAVDCCRYRRDRRSVAADERCPPCELPDRSGCLNSCRVRFTLQSRQADMFACDVAVLGLALQCRDVVSGVQQVGLCSKAAVDDPRDRGDEQQRKN